MTNENNPCVVPSNQQIAKWENLYFADDENLDVILIRAFQAGADQELEECQRWVDNNTHRFGSDLKDFRRPKPPNLKQQALKDLDILCTAATVAGISIDPARIRQALETLND